MKYEPTLLEIILTKLAFIFYGQSVYQAFADRLPLEGGERVLDFGSGMGTVAYFIAPKLPRGQLTCQDISRRWLNACRKTLRRHGNVAFLQGGYQLLRNESYDVAYCHFVLHDIPERELERVIPGLAGALKPGGVLVFREPLKETVKLGAIKRLAEHSRLILKGSRITDIPMLGNALESIYVKE